MDHLNTRIYEEEDGRRVLREFGAEIDALVVKYDLHGIVYTASVKTSEADTEEPAALSFSAVLGCGYCNAVLLAQNIAANFEIQQLLSFLRYLQNLSEQRMADEITRMAAQPRITEVPASDPPQATAPSPQDLLGMRVGKGKAT